MRFFNIFTVLCLLVALSACTSRDHSETVPYLRDGKTPHNTQWENDPWVPQDWIDERGGQVALIDGFYEDGIITDQFLDGAVPVLQVGQTFMRLSALDKRRVLASVDYIFGMTDTEKGMFAIQHQETGEMIGIYTKQGVQFQ